MSPPAQIEMKLVSLIAIMMSSTLIVGKLCEGFVFRRVLRLSLLSPSSSRCWMASVSGIVYGSDDDETAKIKLFTKEGCTLCDKVKDVLLEIKSDYPHSLEQVDITDVDNQEWYEKYKYDIPVLHLNDKYWIKHRTTKEELSEGFKDAQDGKFTEPKAGEPNAGAMERK